MCLLHLQDVEVSHDPGPGWARHLQALHLQPDSVRPAGGQARGRGRHGRAISIATPTCRRLIPPTTTTRLAWRTRMGSRGRGVWSTRCGYGETTHSCSICTRRQPSGATRSSAGQVGPHLIVQNGKLTVVADPNDAFWLAQTHFLTGHYIRAERLLTEPIPQPSVRLPEYIVRGGPSGQGKGKSRQGDEDISAVSSHGYDSSSAMAKGSQVTATRPARVTTKKKLVDQSLACRYLAAQCLVSLCSEPPARPLADLTRYIRRSTTRRLNYWENRIPSMTVSCRITSSNIG